jgi:ubiquinone/menaquinone biosynthesis C-methylase UbiE
MPDLRSAVMRRFWDAHSRGWDDLRAEPQARSHVVEVARWLASVTPTGGSVIDLGCGPGHHSLALAEHGCSVTAVDYSPGMLDLARRKVAARSLEVAFVRADLSRDLPLPEASFDGALCISVIQVLPDVGAFLARVRRLLGPDGHLLVELSAAGGGGGPYPSPRRWQDRLLNDLKHVVARLPGAITRYGPEELARLLTTAGLVPLETRTYARSYAILSRREDAATRS